MQRYSGRVNLRAGGVAFVLVVLAGGASLAAASFSGDGYETADFGGLDGPLGIAVQKDGRIVLAGGTTNAITTFDIAVARFEKGGDIDTTFAGDGKQTTELGGFDTAHDVAIQKDGRIVVVGSAGIGSANDIAVVRYRKGGSPDTSFAGDGVQTTGIGGGASGRGVAIQKDGKIVVVGGKDDDFAVVRYRSNGTLDTSFSGDGKKTTNFGGFDHAEAVAIQDNGRIVAVGSSCIGGGMDCRQNTAIARYKENGSLDRSFSGDGRKKPDLGGFDGANDVAIQDDGRIVVGGTASPNDDADFVVARLKTGGALDKGFGKNGKRRTDFGDSDTGNGLAIQENGRIVLVGSTPATPTVDIALVRYTKGGSLDRSFSGDGKQTTDIGGEGNAALDVAFQSRRKFVVAAGSSIDQDFYVLRYRANGRLDD